MVRLELSKLTAILAALSFWSLWNYWLPTFFVSSIYLGAPHTDFYTFYVAGKAWLAQTNPYLNTDYLFVYPPASLPFFGLFASVDVFSAAQLWTANYFCFFVAALSALVLTIKSERRWLFVSIVLLVFFTSFPLMQTVELGQSDLLVSSIAILSLASYRLRHQLTSAILLSMATLLKGPPVLLLIYFVIFHRDLQYLASFLVSTIVIVAVSLFVVPFQWYWYYIVNIAPTLSVAQNIDLNQSIMRYVSLFGLSRLSPIISFSGICLFSALAFFANSTKGAKVFEGATLADAIFLMNILVMLLFGSRAWPQTYVWSILPVALILSSLLLEKVKSPYLMLVAVGVFLMNTQPTGYTGWFLYQYFVSMVVPMLLIGNLIITISLTPIFLCPNLISQKQLVAKIIKHAAAS